MAVPSTFRNGEQSGPLDILVRYGVLLAVVTYAVGLLAEWVTASRLGLVLADFLLTDRRILVSGGTILFWVGVCIATHLESMSGSSVFFIPISGPQAHVKLRTR